MPIITNRNKIELLPEDKKFIQENFDEMTNAQLAEALGLRLTRLRYFLAEMGLRRMEMEYFTVDQVEFLKANYVMIGDVEMAEIYEAQWPKNKKWTNKHIRKKRCYLNLHRDASQINDVRKRNVKAGRYNTVNQRWKTMGVTPVGQIKIWRNQNNAVFPVIKLETGFVHYYRWLYMQTHGQLDTDQLVVPKKDAPLDRLLEVGELEVIDRAEHARRNVERIMQVPEDIRENIRLVNKIKKQIKAYDTKE